MAGGGFGLGSACPSGLPVRGLAPSRSFLQLENDMEAAEEAAQTEGTTATAGSEPVRHRSMYPGAPRHPAPEILPAKPRDVPSHLSGELVLIRARQAREDDNFTAETRNLAKEVNGLRGRVEALYAVDAELQNDHGLTPVARAEKLAAATSKLEAAAQTMVGRSMVAIQGAMDREEKLIRQASAPRSEEEAREFRAVLRALTPKEQRAWFQELVRDGGEGLKAIAGAERRLVGLTQDEVNMATREAGKRYAPENVRNLLELEAAFNAGVETRKIYEAALGPVRKELDKHAFQVKLSEASRTRRQNAWDKLSQDHEPAA